MNNNDGRYHDLDDIYWAQDISAAQPFYQTTLPDRTHIYDVVIIGAGYTGLASALKVAEAQRSVAILEAFLPGYGASGRNAGHVAPVLATKDSNDVLRILGPEIGAKVNRWIANSAATVFDLIDEYNINCSANPSGQLSLVRRKSRLPQLKEKVEQWTRFGVEVEFLTDEQTALIAPNSPVAGGWRYKDGGFINPYLYCLGLAKAASKAGAEIYIQNLVTNCTRERDLWRVTTTGGEIVAKQLGVATNASLPDTNFCLSSRGVPIECSMLASDSYCFSDHLTWRGPWIWADDPLMFGGYQDHSGCLSTSVLVASDAKDMSGAARAVTKNMRKYFPEAPLPKWSKYWRGRFLMTSDGLPKLTKLAEACFAGFGFNGVGITGATLMGVELAKLLLGNHAELVAPIVKAPRLRSRAALATFAYHVGVPFARKL